MYVHMNTCEWAPVYTCKHPHLFQSALFLEIREFVFILNIHTFSEAELLEYRSQYM